MPTESQSIRTELVVNHDEFLGMREPWNQLLSNTQNDSLPLTHEWFTAWWNAFGLGKSLNIYSFFLGDRLVAIAPFSRTKRPFLGFNLETLELMANGHSPFCDILLDSTLEEVDVSSVVQELIHIDPADVISFLKVPEESRISICAGNSRSVLGLPCGRRPGLVTPIISLAGGWEPFFSSLSRGFRRSIRHKWNRVKKTGGLQVERHVIRGRDDPAIDEMVSISLSSWKQSINMDLSTNRASLSFLLSLTDVFGPAGAVEIWMARRAGEPVAFEFHVKYKQVVYALNSAFHEGYRELSPGSLLEYAILETLFEENDVECYDTCADDYWYLRNWAPKMRRHYDIEVFRVGGKQKLAYFIRYVAKPLLGSMRELIKREHGERNE